MEDQMKPQEEVVEGKIYFVNNVINRWSTPNVHFRSCLREGRVSLALGTSILFSFPLGHQNQELALVLGSPYLHVNRALMCGFFSIREIVTTNAWNAGKVHSRQSYERQAFCNNYSDFATILAFKWKPGLNIAENGKVFETTI
jgi:hypothetical protein